MRTETDNLLHELEEMRKYFQSCAMNCQLGSAAYKRFKGYVFTLTKVISRLREAQND